MLVSGSYDQSGAEYRTEHDRFDKIVQTGADSLGPTGFLVYRQDGTVDSYGNDQSTALALYFPESTSTLQGNVATVGGYTQNDTNSPTVSYDTPVRLSWGIGARANRYGAVIHCRYTPIQQAAPDYAIEFRIDNITYNGGSTVIGGRTIQFNYSPTTMKDSRQSYVSGLPLTLSHLLSSIDVRGPSPRSDGVLRTYKLSQLDQLGSRALLNTVTECDGAGVCKVPTTFTYTPQDQSFTRIDTGVQADWHSVIIPGDENGDGKDDLIAHSSGLTFGVWEVLPSTGSGLGAPIAVNYTLPARSPSNPFLNTGGRVADLNMDGRADFIVPAYDAGGLHMEPLLSTPSGYTNFDATDYEDMNLPPWSILPILNHATPIYIADFNGDGLPDFMRATAPGLIPLQGPAPLQAVDWSFRMNAPPTGGMTGYQHLVYPSPGTNATVQGVEVADVLAFQDSNSYTTDLDGDGASEFLVTIGTRMGALKAPSSGVVSPAPRLTS